MRCMGKGARSKAKNAPTKGRKHSDPEAKRGDQRQDGAQSPSLELPSWFQIRAIFSVSLGPF